MRNNISKYYIYTLTSSILAMLAGGTILQAFLIEIGIGEQAVGTLMSVMQIMQVAVMVGLSRKMDGSKKIIEITAYSRLLDLPLIIFLFGICFFTNINKTFLLCSVLVLMLIYSFGVGITNISAYKLPYIAIDVNEYGKIAARGGLFGGILTFGISWAISWFQKNYSYFSVMKGVFLFIMAAAACYVAVTGRIKPIYVPEKSGTSEKSINILRYKPFTRLIIPNLLRGFNAGVIGIAVTLGYYVGLMDEVAATYMVIASNIATFASCYVYSAISGKIKEGKILLISSIIVCVLLPMMLFGNNKTVFIAFYTVVFFFYNIINYAVPTAVVKFVNYDVAGQYNAGRMILHTLGMSLAGFVCVAMFKLIGPLATLIFAGGCQLVSGLGYYMFLNKRKSDL